MLLYKQLSVALLWRLALYIYLYSYFLKYKKGYLKLQLKKIINFPNTSQGSILPGQIL